MRFHAKLIAVAGVIWGMSLAALTAHAQLPPISKEVEMDDPAIKAVADKQQPQFHHGMRLVVTLNTDERVVGTVVYANEDKGYLALRPRPGAVPQKITGKEIKEIASIKPAALTPRPDDGGIVPAVPGETKLKPPMPYDPGEIHAVEINNGPYRSVQYTGPSLSPPEQRLLENLEQAENEYGAAQLKFSLNKQFVINERLIGSARREALTGYYQHATHYALGFQPVSQLYPYYVGYPGYIPYPVLHPYREQFAGHFYAYRPAGFAGYPNLAYGGDMMINPVAGEMEPSVIKAAAATYIAQEATPEALAQAKARLDHARRYAVYNDRGEVVAMNIFDPQPPLDLPSNGPVRPVGPGEKDAPPPAGTNGR